MSDREIREAERRCLDDPDDLDADLHRIALLRRAHRLPFRRIHTAARLLDPVALQVMAPAVTRPIYMAVDPLGTPWLRPNAIDRATHPLRIVECAALALHALEYVVACSLPPAPPFQPLVFADLARAWIRRPIRQNLHPLQYFDVYNPFPPKHPHYRVASCLICTHTYFCISRTPHILAGCLQYLDRLHPVAIGRLCADLLLLRPRSVYARILRDPQPKGPAP